MNFRRTTSVLARTAVAVALGVSGTIALGSPAQAAPSGICEAYITSITDNVAGNDLGVPDLVDSTLGDQLPAGPIKGTVLPGSVVTITFDVKGTCKSAPFTLATYKADLSLIDDSEAFFASQTLFNAQSKKLRPGTGYKLSVKVPARTADSPVGIGPDCTNKFLTERLEQSYNGNGGSAEDGNQYASTCDGRASENGNGGGNANGRPCQGCVGNADNKNPPGQYPNGSDANNGYECDGNNGVGKGNPAHTGCASSQNGFQIDFYRGPVMKTVPADGLNPNYAWQVGG